MFLVQLKKSMQSMPRRNRSYTIQFICQVTIIGVQRDSSFVCAWACVCSCVCRHLLQRLPIFVCPRVALPRSVFVTIPRPSRLFVQPPKVKAKTRAATTTTTTIKYDRRGSDPPLLSSLTLPPLWTPCRAQRPKTSSQAHRLCSGLRILGRIVQVLHTNSITVVSGM